MTLSFGQSPDLKAMVDRLQYLKADMLDCNTSLYWRIIAQCELAIPLLIEKLNDTSLTNISYKCKATKLNVGDVAYFALDEIGSFPIYVITKMRFDWFENNGCWSFFDYLFDNSSKTTFQNLFTKWYADNKPKFRAKKISRKRMTDCQKLYNIKNYFRWKS